MANLYGSDDVLTSVNMNNVTYLSPSFDGSPQIWGTGEVNGTYASNPAIDHTVGLSGNGLDVDFSVKRWDNGVWGATVNGGGTYIGEGAMNGSNIDMKGVAAGTIDSATEFSGTGAGVVRTGGK